MEETVDKLDLTKIENFCSTEGNAKRMRTPTWGINTPGITPNNYPQVITTWG